MNDFVCEQESFVQDDVTTRLRRLATHLSQIQSLWTQGSSEDLILALVDESRYFIE
ncbi:hypothetical protein NIES4072_67640 [Nostoc commune NIES-4072]|uniref:Uncharacterized protein n=1 Tax=Nostoc commune NIES-4072 TaxID=2005467 RepID=A0A2R5FWC2_NOSCO|nr:hypothetical protein [Nostoc commune]BBD70398.1 hypothetical protein NIES4070_68090 [Nostoc commune HK-02]GBG23052.1 hypothetical protein NIES4072_67640 [Nostoc commune NIES-4072]